MKILYVITGLGQGGAERVVCDLADKMYEKGFQVKIAYLTGEILTKPNHKEIQLIKIGLNSLTSLPTAYKKLSNIISYFQPDIVHAHMIHANLISRLIRIRIPIKKLICTAHSANEGGRLRMFLYRITHNLSDYTTNVSLYASNSFIKQGAVPKNGINTIYNGVNFNKFKYNNFAREKIQQELNISADTKILLAVGRFHAAKNYFNLIKAINILKFSLDNFVLLIAGDGELRSDIEKLILKLELSNKIILLGRRNDISDLMSACDVFVLSSNYEGLPTVLIEALACQAHVVSTDVSGAKEIIDKYGKIILKNNPEILSEAIEEALKYSSKNILAKEYVKNKFDLEVISNQWRNIYQSK